MPDDTGNLPPVPAGADGWQIAWPVNPHFTGRSGIVIMLQALADIGKAPVAGMHFV
jgi:hypothetical protein